MSELSDRTTEKYRSYLIGERKSRHTVKQYTHLARNFLVFLDKPVSSVTPDDVEKYKSYLVTTKKYSKSSQHLAVNAIRLLLKSNNIPVPLNLTPPRKSRKMPVYLSQKEASLLLKSSRDDSRKHAIVSTLMYSGVRVSELCSLDLDDVDLDENILLIRSGKGDKGRIVVVPDDCTKAIRSYLRLRSKMAPPTKSLFVSNKKSRYDTSTIERIIREVTQLAGIKKRVTPHVLRHTLATSIMRNGGDIRFIQEILGHASVATTQIYTHIDENTLKEMYEKYRPKF